MDPQWCWGCSSAHKKFFKAAYQNPATFQLPTSHLFLRKTSKSIDSTSPQNGFDLSSVARFSSTCKPSSLLSNPLTHLANLSTEYNVAMLALVVRLSSEHKPSSSLLSDPLTHLANLSTEYIVATLVSVVTSSLACNIVHCCLIL